LLNPYIFLLFEFRMFSEYHFSDMEIYHITNLTRITRILLSIESILRLYHHIVILGEK
jgi:hypothetical protein